MTRALARALVRAEHVPVIAKVAERERSGYCVVGTITGDGRVVVHDAKDDTIARLQKEHCVETRTEIQTVYQS